MRTPPLPSPAKAPSSVASCNRHHRRPSRPHLSNPDPFVQHDPDPLAFSMQQYGFSRDDSPVHSPNPAAAAACVPEYCAESSPSPDHSRHGRPGLPHRSQRQSMHTLDELRKHMEETFVYHSRSGSHFFTTDAPGSSQDMKLSRKAKRSIRSTPTSPSSAPIPPGSFLNSSGHTDSSSSSRTIRLSKQTDHSELSAFPFPTSSSLAASVNQSLDPLADARPIVKRLSIRRTKPRKNKSPLTTAPSAFAELNGSTWKDPFMAHDANTTAEDPRYPTPNLYDITLALNSEAGLDAWWSNTVRVLHAHFGAERASLAIPGDSTDLENVPWGQKATYSLYGYKASSSSTGTTPGNYEAETPSKDSSAREATDADKRQSDSKSSKLNGQTLAPSKKRPPMVTRQSFAGFGRHGNADTRDKNMRPDGPTRAKSSLNPATIQPRTKDDKDSTPSPDHTSGTTSEWPSQPSVDSTERTPCPSVALFPVPRALEVESDPLIKRTGVVKLFGRTTPAILTRQYSHDPMASPLYDSITKQASRDDTAQESPGATVLNEPTTCNVSIARTSVCSASSTSTTTQTITELPRPSVADYSNTGTSPPNSSCSDSYEEYEQIPQSPWSQSPALSPAPRSNPKQNPFFNSSSRVDEDAFASSPPLHDYSTNQPVEAIGVDRAKTIIHIPLVHSSSSKQPASNTLRFPVAIISILTPIIPYPANLRKALGYLLPHLTTSFCLAQQYSQLEWQLSTSRTQRFGHILGLGGTFSDASSEMELVAGLSSHVNYPLGENVSLQGHSSISSPLQRSDTGRSNAAVSGANTPGLEFGGGMPRDIYLTPSLMSKYASDTSDSYFNIKQQPGGMLNQQRLRQPKSMRDPSASMSPQQGSSRERSTEFDELTSRDPGLVPTSSTRTPSVVTSPQGSSRYASSASIATQLHRELSPRPFPDTIAQLMLNSVPLHLFLAKPHTGEVIWTNDKFDYYRRSQPHEQRARDPWLDVHESERENFLNEWAKALRSGSQFTERVRVKRYNDESTYRWFIFRANPLLSQTGELLYWIGSFLDVHEQHIAEMKAAQEREVFATNAKYKALANSIPQVVFEAAEYRGLISANEQWQLYTGQSLEDALNLGFAKHIHRDDLEKCGILLPPNIIPESDYPIEFGCIMSSPRSSKTSTENLELGSSGSTAKPPPISRTNSMRDKNGRSTYRGLTHALHDLVEKGVVTIQKDENGRYSYTTEIRLRSRGGDFRWHLVRLVKVETTSFGDGEASWYGTCTDINDRKLLERKLNREMESKTKFFSNMSHEIRTPLNGILGTIPFILDTQLDNDQRRMLDTIQNSSTNLRELVDNILDVSKVEAGKMNIVQQWFHVRSIVEDVIDTIGSRAIDKGLELNYLVESDVPAMVIGDRFRIRQILINLMGNAVKFTSQGEIYTRCSIHHDPSVSVNGTEILLRFEVVDTGKGFSSTDAERLMQRFSQIEGSGSQQHAGSGLGLFLSKQLVEMHGGRLTSTSKEGQGAKFSFFVKVDAPPPPPPQDPSRSNHDDRYLQPVDDTNTLKSPSRQEFPFTQDLLSLHSPTNSDVLSLPSKQLSGSSWGSNQFNTPPSSQCGGTPSKTDQPSEKTAPLDIPTQNVTGTGVIVSSPSSQNPPPVLPSSYNVLIICPFDYAREAVKQHIEQVIPLEVTCKVTAVLDIEDWKDLVASGDCPNFTHLAVSLPDANDVKEAMQMILQCDCDNNNNNNHNNHKRAPPTLIIVSDIYQKREISEAYVEFRAAGGKGFLVPKPVKPSSFSRIFDPYNQRDLSNDRNQDMAREINNSFKTMSKIVKEVIGNKGYRILLVEDDEINRTVMLKYLEKVKLASETAGNGQECVDMVFSKEPGYYSLIICDIQMPVKNGYETCQEIRSWEQRNHFPQIPIMALSANAMMDQIDDASRAGFNHYVTKPIKHNELGKMMMELLDPSVPQVLLRDRNKLGCSPSSSQQQQQQQQ